MRATIRKHGLTLISGLFGLVILLFWGMRYPAVLSFQEQYQLFLFDWGYFAERIALPGGLSDYVAEFLTQFYYITWIGALFLATIYVLIQRVTWRLAQANGATAMWYPLSFLPSVILLLYMGDENVMLSLPLSILFTLLIALGYTQIKSKKACISWVYIIVSVPVCYWLLGTSVYVLALYAILKSIKKHPVLSVFTLVYTLLAVIGSSCFLRYPMYRVLFGLNYYRYPESVPYFQMLFMLFAAITPSVISLASKCWGNDKMLSIKSAAGYIILILCLIFIPRLSYGKLKYELIDYDYLVRTEQWDRIIDMAKRHQPSTPMGVACVNLALAQAGQLGDRMFEFYQNGGEGLFPVFQRDMTSPLPTAEAFYRLGMINDAQRYFFEAQEAIPNFQKSGRCMTRLAQTNLINGDYAVAEKYLRLLGKTIFYRAWANKTMSLLYDEKAINADPEYGKLRRYRQKGDDYLFSDREMDQMLGLLFVTDYHNKMAFEYLMAYELLQRDLTRFNEYYPLGKYADYDHIPKAYQEALVYMWTQAHPSFEGMPWSISPEVCQLMVEFAQRYTTNPSDPALSVGALGQTFWSYLLVNKGTAKSGKEKSKPIY